MSNEADRFEMRKRIGGEEREDRGSAGAFWTGFLLTIAFAALLLLLGKVAGAAIASIIYGG